MSQYRAGWVEVISGSNRVISTGTDWSSIEPGHIFIVQGKHVPYFVSSTSVVSGNWEATLSAPYMQISATGQSYALVTSFTNLLNIPLIEPGDIETATIFNRAMGIIEQEIGELGGAAGIQEQTFTYNVPTGVNKVNITYPTGVFTSIPNLVVTLQMPPTSEYFYLVQTSGITPTGFWAIFSNTISAANTGFKLHVFGKV